MDETGSTLGIQYNTEVAKAFVHMGQQGWANESTGEDDFGSSVWLFIIEPNEMSEINEAFDNDLQVTVYPGAYVAALDSDGNKQVTEFLSNVTAIAAFRKVEEAYAKWSKGCAHEGCGYGECSWLQGGRDGMCDTHANGEGKCQKNLESDEITRHMFDFKNNAATIPLCHNLLTGGAVVRQVITNVNCPACLDLYEREQITQSDLDEMPEDSEKLFLVCVEYGEAFETIEDTVGHGDPDDEDAFGECKGPYKIVPESEAF